MHLDPAVRSEVNRTPAQSAASLQTPEHLFDLLLPPVRALDLRHAPARRLASTTVRPNPLPVVVLRIRS